MPRPFANDTPSRLLPWQGKRRCGFRRNPFHAIGDNLAKVLMVEVRSIGIAIQRPANGQRSNAAFPIWPSCHLAQPAGPLASYGQTGGAVQHDMDVRALGAVPIVIFPHKGPSRRSFVVSHPVACQLQEPPGCVCRVQVGQAQCCPMDGDKPIEGQANGNGLLRSANRGQGLLARQARAHSVTAQPCPSP